MKSSIKIASLSGIPLFLHWTFLLIPAYVLLSGYAMGRPPFGIAADMALVCVIFLCVVLHELGHALAARRYGISTRDIILMPIGGVARLERIPRRPIEEFVVAIAGPCVNLILATVLLAVSIPLVGMEGLITPTSLAANLVGKTIAVNIVMIIFNLLPAFPLDGGRIFRAALSWKLGHVNATRIAARTGQLLAIGMGMVGLFYFENPMLMFIALFVFSGAKQELNSAVMEASLDQLSVRDALITGFDFVPAHASIGWGLRYALSVNSREVPVLEGRQYLGQVRTKDLAIAMRSGHESVSVRSVCSSPAAPLKLDQALTDAVRAFQETDVQLLPVEGEDGQLEGFVSRQSIVAAGQFGTLVERLPKVVVQQKPDELRQHFSRMQLG